MDVDYVINESNNIIGSNIEKVYAACLSWLELKKAKIIEQRMPEYIKAHQGHGSRGIKDIGKHFIIKLRKKGYNSTMISFQIPSSPWVNKKSDVRAMYFYEFVEDLWLHVGIPIDETFLRYIYPDSNLKKMIKNNYIEFLIITIALSASFIVFLIIKSWMIVIPVGAWFFFARDNLFEIRRLKDRLKELYPNKK